ncbi:MAG: 5-formyltetrahydrofolate cyclo-ligase [Burkholderiales bacterium]|nr:5-formyltetrahydrofolate cyclo-ligase [Burkholderiales bacterium]
MNPPDDLKAWRKAQRAALLTRRQMVAEERYRDWTAVMTRRLVGGFPLLGGMTVGLYWPFQGEFDARFAIREFRQRGAVAALPEVVQKGAPLRFREWWPGVATTPGVYDLPVPDTPVVVPQALLIPPVGFDERGYRLGYGGGFFDRTLASIKPMPLKIGVAFELSRIDTIHPQPHDIPMDFIVTEVCIYRVGADGLERIEESSAAALAEVLVRDRGRAAGSGARAE